MKTRWYKDAVIYQIYPRSFKDSNGDGIGDLQGIISELDYIKELGVDAIWLSPIYASPNDDNGYDISDYRAILPEFGTLDDFKMLVKEMKKRNLKLIMDLVVNHSSDEHYWFQESRKSLDNPYREYYIWRKGRGKNGTKPPNNWLSNFTGSAWEKDDLTGEYYLHLFSKKQPDLNWKSPKLRQEIADICNFWLELGVDGFRCDVIPFISKPADLENYNDWNLLHPLRGIRYYTIHEDWMKYMQELGDKSYNQEKYDTLIVGECPNVKFDLAKTITKESNRALDTLFEFEHVNADYFQYIIPIKLKLKRLKKIYKKWSLLPHDSWNSAFYESHDYQRSISHYGNDKEFRVESGKMLATSYMLQPATPYIYQGQEIGMINYNFKREEFADIMSVNILNKTAKIPFLKNYAYKVLLKRARDHARTPMQWNTKENAGFTTGKPWFLVNPNYNEINVEQSIKDHDSIFYYYKKLINIKHTYAEHIKNSLYIEHMKNSKEIYSYQLHYKGKTLLVVCNFFKKTPEFKIEGLNFTKSKLLIANYKTKEEKLSNFKMKPYESRVYYLE